MFARVFLTVGLVAIPLALSFIFSTVGNAHEGHDHHEPDTFLVYIGTYTGPESEGIYTFEFDRKSGKLTPINQPAKTSNPSFVAVHPSGDFLYAVNEDAEFNGEKGGGITSFSIDPETGALTEINSQCTHGEHPCHLTIDQTGRTVGVANYTGGSIAAYRIGRDGALSPASTFVQHQGKSVHPRQEAPHGHSIDVDPANRFMAVSDLGIDQVLIYKMNARKGQLTAHSTVKSEPGAGPRHFSFHPTGKFGFGINELNMTANAYRYDARAGRLELLQTVSTLPPGEKQQEGQSTAEMYVHPNGKFLYGSNRGHNTIVVYGIDQKTGKLSYVENESTGGSTPRSFGVVPTGDYLLALNQASNTIVVFKIDPGTGALEPTGEEVLCPTPVAAAFLAR
ncbi:MAG: 6-phosphogluconolactonase [Planctomycetaceae bacterium]|nr:6-phosphogluconolactonase [Planctomycetaceae bacterium]|tara:strand:- start:1970 stop:3151 length:1182 start_codon:yes stop_codon:yes gene_type:complete